MVVHSKISVHPSKTTSHIKERNKIKDMIEFPIYCYKKKISVAYLFKKKENHS